MYKKYPDWNELKNKACHLFAILSGGKKNPKPLQLWCPIYIFLKTFIKKIKSVIKMSLCVCVVFFFNNINRLPLSTNTICFPKMPGSRKVREINSLHN